MSDESTPPKKPEGKDPRPQRDEATRPDDIARKHGESSIDPVEAHKLGDLITGEPSGIDTVWPSPPPYFDKLGGGMQAIDPPVPIEEPSSILDSIESADPRERVAEQFGGGAAGRSVQRPVDRANWLRVASLGMAAGGLFLLLWAFTGGRIPQPPVTKAQPTASAAPTAAPATATPVPTATTAGTPLSAGPIVATFNGTTTSYTVEAVQGSALKYQWAHSATCGSHTGETTVNYVWDHPHPPCPDEPFHSSFITVQVTDGAGFALVRQYPTLGSRAGRGVVPAGGGVFATQTPFPTTAVRTTAPATTALATASPSTASTTTDGGPNYPLGLGGIALTAGGLGLAYLGRKEKDPCAELRRRESAARDRRDGARERAARLDHLRTEADRTHAEADRTQRAERDSKDDRQSWWEDAETGVRTYTDPDQRGRIEHAEAAASAARAAADAARSAFDTAGGASAQTAARADRQRADADLQAAESALADCVSKNAPPAPQPAPQPAPTPAPPTPPAPPPPPAPTPPTPPIIARATPTQVRVCEPGTVKPESERSTTHAYRVIDLRSATIIARHSALDTDKVPLGQGLLDGDGPDGERGSGAFAEMFQYWRDATEIGAGRARNAVTRDPRLQVLGQYSFRYTVRTYEITCTTREECNAQGTGYIRPKGRVSMAAAVLSEEETDPPVTADVQNADHTTVTREIIRVVTGIARELQSKNRAAEEAAKAFTKACG